MNFLAEVISTAEKVEMATIKDSLTNISREIESNKNEVTKFVASYYENYNETRNVKLLRTSEKLMNDLTDIKQHMQGTCKTKLNTSVEEVDSIANSIDELDVQMTFTHTLIDAHERLERIKASHEAHDYGEAFRQLNALNDKLQTLPTDSIADFVAQHVHDVTAGMKTTLRTECDENITTTVREKPNQILATFGVETNKRLRCVNALDILESDSLNSATFYQLSSFLWKNILQPAINCRVNVTSDINDKQFLLTVTSSSTVETPTYDEVFQNLQTIFTHLHSAFLTDDNTSPLMFRIAQRYHKKIVSALINDCLMETIPSSETGLDDFKGVLVKIDKLYVYFIEIGFVAEQLLPLKEFVDNVDVLFVDKKCQTIYEQAAVLMKKDLHDTVQIQDDQTKSNAFPRCHVSRSCVELLELIGSLLSEYSNDSTNVRKKVYATIDTIFDQYPNVVKEYHKKLLESIPQQSALFRNNCMYLTHNLSHKTAPLWTGTTDTFPNDVGFDKHLHRLTLIGEDTFVTFVNEQQKQMEVIIKKSGLDELQRCGKLNANVEKSIRQCIRQQELLKTVWQKILSYEVYNKTLGKLLGAFCRCLIDGVMCASDISSVSAEQLVDMFNVVLTRGPKLLSDPKEINMYVEVWNKFKHLTLIIGSKLLDISDQWADGKGPLALYFTANEVKQLIKAIFQSTEHRRNVLLKIF